MICQFCNNGTAIKNSHIIPKFVFKDMKVNSTGYIRENININERQQDGFKCEFLCSNCEELFSADETLFSQKFYKPIRSAIRKDISIEIEYGKWAFRFLSGLHWRILKWHLFCNNLKHLEDAQLHTVNDAIQEWRAFLQGNTLVTKHYPIKVVVLDNIRNLSRFNLSPFFHQYMYSAVSMDVVRAGQYLFQYCKMGRLFTVAILKDHPEGFFDLPTIKNGKGKFKPGHYSIPEVFLAHLNQRANELKIAFDSMSSKQWDLISKEYLNKPELLESEIAKGSFLDSLQFRVR